MSLSAIRANPSMAEPSNHFRRRHNRANSREGIVTLFITPTVSINWRLMYLTPPLDSRQDRFGLAPIVRREARHA